MSALVWKLLRQHISIGQLAGFFLANLFGMMIVLLSVQFYKDIIPVFTEGCLLYTSPSPRDRSLSRMPSSA